MKGSSCDFSTNQIIQSEKCGWFSANFMTSHISYIYTQPHRHKHTYTLHDTLYSSQIVQLNGMEKAIRLLRRKWLLNIKRERLYILAPIIYGNTYEMTKPKE